MFVIRDYCCYNSNEPQSKFTMGYTTQYPKLPVLFFNNQDGKEIMNLMGKEELQTICADSVIEFNRLITTGEERNSPSYIELCIKNVLEEMDELDDAIASGDRAEILKELCDLFVVKTQLKDCITNTTLELPYKNKESIYYLSMMAEEEFKKEATRFTTNTLYSAISAVNVSNLSKIPPISSVKAWYGEDDYIGAACDWIETENKGRYKGVVGIERMGKVIFRADKGEGKLVKWVGYKEADINSVLGE